MDTPKPQSKPETAAENGGSRSQQRVVGLPDEWQGLIPPQPIIIVEDVTSLGRYTRPEWNPQWLAGLEKHIRAIVQDELRQANDELCHGVAEEKHE
jgi:hypothetical protein